MWTTAGGGGRAARGQAAIGVALSLAMTSGVVCAGEAASIQSGDDRQQFFNATSPSISFEEVSEREGISWSGVGGNPAFSISWLDFNRDGWPDLWVAPHGYNRASEKLPSLYLRRAGAEFADDFRADWIPQGRGGDSHGSTWVDFDNDGDPDLFVSQGAQKGVGSGPKLLFVNDDGVLRDEAEPRGLDYPLGRGRSSSWFDWDGDGLLDVLMAVGVRPDGKAPTAFFRQTPLGTFVNATGAVALDLKAEARFADLADLSGDGQPDLLITMPEAKGTSPVAIYDISGATFRDITGLVMPAQQVAGKDFQAPISDVVVADFNNDTFLDLLITRFVNEVAGSGVSQWGKELVSADLVASRGEVGLRFSSEGDGVYFNRYHFSRPLPESKVFIGWGGRHPASFGFKLSSADPTAWGIMPHAVGAQTALYIGYDPVRATWEALLSSPTEKPSRLLIKGDRGIKDLSGLGFGPLDVSKNAVSPLLLLYEPTTGRYVDRTSGSGLDDPGLCQSAAAGDFDNDMDVDIYMSCDYFSYSVDNKLYENLGDGSFRMVPGAGGASGRAVGPHYLDFGLGARLAMADYNNDGFLDLFLGPTVAVATGDRTAFLGAPPQLFRNRGNDYHWIELELEGVRSNRDGIGAEVLVTAGDITQVRHQGGGMHHFAQNHARMHFGLGKEKRISEIMVRWPSGITQRVADVPADQVLTVIEPSRPRWEGTPTYEPGSTAGVFLWKDTQSGDFEVRASAGGKETGFQIKLISTRPIVGVPVGLEADDNWTAGRYGLSLLAAVGAADDLEDGLTFRIERGAKTLLAVEQDGEANPRQLHVGAKGLPLSPAGWIVSGDALQRGTAPKPGAQAGLWIGRGERPKLVEVRFSGNGKLIHRTEVDLIAEKRISSIVPRNLEAGDRLRRGVNTVRLVSRVSGGWDGVDLEMAPESEVGIAYRQDFLFQPRSVTTGAGQDLGEPNAYWVE